MLTDSTVEHSREVSFPPSGLVVPACLNSAPRLLVFIGGFFAIQVVLRLITSRTTVLDESGQIVFSQAWQWGYGPQPPLYTWLQILFFKVCGPSVLGLTLLKNALLLCSYALTYGSGRIVTRSHAGGLIAALALLFIPQIAWESQRDLTHSVLAMTMAIATLFVFLKLHQTGARWMYLLFGALVGLGILSNYNYALLLVGLLIAALLVKEFHPLVLSPWMLAAIAIAMLLVWPHAHWAAQNWSVLVSSSHKLRMRPDTSRMVSTLHAVGNLAGAWFSHVISVVLVFAVLCWRQLLPFPREVLRRPMVRLILLLLCIALVATVIGMITSQATSIRGRWLQPIFFCVPILAAALVCGRLTRFALRSLVTAAALVAVAVIVLFPTRIWFAEKLGRGQYLNAPYAELTAQVRGDLERADLILADEMITGGNVRLLFPDKNIMTPQFNSRPLGKAQTTILVLFDATAAVELPMDLERLLSTWGVELKPAEIHYVEARLRSHHKEQMRLGVALLTLPAGPGVAN